MKRIFLALLALAGCQRQAPPGPPHYVLGTPYQAGGLWRYPREEFMRDETGIATTVQAHGRLTADGEAFDAGALAASHPTLQLPALARITNLDNGRRVLVRVNDRGPATPARIVEVTRRAAELLQAADPAAIKIRFQVVEDASRRMVAELREEAPKLALNSAPAGGVQSESLAPPPGATQSARGPSAAAVPAPQAVAPVVQSAVPLRLPEQVTQVYVPPAQLQIDCGGFSRPDAADVLRNRLAQLGARTVTNYYAPRDRAYIVRIGPLPDVAAAEAMVQARAVAGRCRGGADCRGIGGRSC